VLVNLVRPRSRAEQFWALRDVSFEVQPGRSTGIIGTNGSGKSTALKLVSGILRPTSGKIEVVGRVAGLLELGAGFHPELTGRENVFLSGTILGMRQREMKRRFDEIVAFAELERFIDTPVKHYSSGMYMRLAFAVATSVDPDILLIDEVLSVGDSSFQEKCFQRIQSFQRAGKTLIFVSHGLASVANLCSRVVWLHNGSVKSEGEANRVVNEYLEFTSAKREAAEADAPPPAEPSVEHPVRIARVEIQGSDGVPRITFETGEEMVISIGYAALEPGLEAAFGVTIARGDGTYCYAVNTQGDGLRSLDLKREGEVRIAFDPLTLLTGTFFIDVAVLDPETQDYLDFRQHAAMFKVRSDRADMGVAVLPHRWQLQGGSAP
jgi:ABC-type polysaccharide/polyol phosphate transport system ATPase subunit